MYVYISRNLSANITSCYIIAFFFFPLFFLFSSPSPSLPLLPILSLLPIIFSFLPYFYSLLPSPILLFSNISSSYLLALPIPSPLFSLINYSPSFSLSFLLSLGTHPHSLSRYYAICCQPLVYRNKMTPLRIALMLGGCWVIPMFISFLPIMQGWNNIGIIDLVSRPHAHSHW